VFGVQGSSVLALLSADRAAEMQQFRAVGRCAAKEAN